MNSAFTSFIPFMGGKSDDKVPGGEVGVSNEDLDTLKVKQSDQELKNLTQPYLEQGFKTKAMIQKTYDENKAYYKGIQDADSTSDNRIFLSLETIIPIATASPAVPNVIPGDDDINALEFAKNWEAVLTDIYVNSKLQRKTERSIRHLSFAKFTCLKAFYDPLEDEINVKVVHPKKVMFNENIDLDDGVEVVIEIVSNSAEEMIKLFPKKKQAIEMKTKKKLGAKVTYYEIWTNELVIWRDDDTIYGARDNPNWSFKNKGKNFLKRPRHPYFFTNQFDIGEGIMGTTSLIDQCKELQDEISRTKGQIAMNAEIMNGKVVVYGEGGITEQQVADIDWSDTTAAAYFPKGRPGELSRETGQAMPSFIGENMQDSRNEIDNMMGTHSTTRGERQGRETATGRVELKSSDRGRIDSIGRRYEEMFQDIFRYWTQLHKIHGDENNTFRVLGSDGAKKFIQVNKKNLDKKMIIKVIPGTLIPDDRESRMNKALSLANSQLIDPITLFRDLGYQNPEKMAENLWRWQNQPESLFPNIQQEQAGAGEAATEANVQQAFNDIEKLNSGAAVAPFEGADANHIAAHAQFINSPEFGQLNPKIQQAHVEHVRIENQSVEQSVKQ
jgi:hypothetical protein